MLINFIKDKMIERTLHKMEKKLREVNYVTLKHELMKMKWQALRENDDITYDAIGNYEELVAVLEKMFSPKEVN